MQPRPTSDIPGPARTKDILCALGAARMRPRFENMNAPLIARDRAAPVLFGVAVFLTALCMLLLLVMIFGWAIDRALQDAAIAPSIMAF